MNYADYFSATVWKNMINDRIFNERDRAILKRRVLDGITYERLAEEFAMSPRQVKRIVYKGTMFLLEHTGKV